MITILFLFGIVSFVTIFLIIGNIFTFFYYWIVLKDVAWGVIVVLPFLIVSYIYFTAKVSELICIIGHIAQG